MATFTIKPSKDNLGNIHCIDFHSAYLRAKDPQSISITNNDSIFEIVTSFSSNGTVQHNSYEFTRKDIVILKSIYTTEVKTMWAMKFKDNKVAIITTGTGIQIISPDGDRKILPDTGKFLELFGDLIVNNCDENVSIIRPRHILDTGKKCPKCGVPIDDEMSYCGECGEKLK